MRFTPNQQRPKHLALHLIKLPLPGIVSILHRASGLVLFFCLPILLYILQASLQSPETYMQLKVVFEHPVVKLVLLGLSWAFLHHFCAGLRYLAIDLHAVRNLAQARSSSKIVMAVSLLLTVIVGGELW